MDEPGVLSEAQEVTLAEIVNTCDYCTKMIPSLHSLLYKEIDETYKDRIDLDGAKSMFDECVSTCLMRIKDSLEAKVTV